MKRHGILIVAALTFIGGAHRAWAGDESVAAIVRAAAVPEPVPPAAMEKVTHLGAPAIPELLALARSDQPREATAAIIALGSIGPAAFDTLQQLKPAISHRPDAVQVVFQLAYTTAACQSRRTLADCWRSSTHDERGQASLVMILLGARALGALLENAADADPELRKYALQTADVMLEPKLMKRVLPAMFSGADHDPTVLLKILTAHRRDVEAVRGDRDEEIRVMAENLLRLMGQSDAHK